MTCNTSFFSLLCVPLRRLISRQTAEVLERLVGVLGPYSLWGTGSWKRSESFVSSFVPGGTWTWTAAGGGIRAAAGCTAGCKGELTAAGAAGDAFISEFCGSCVGLLDWGDVNFVYELSTFVYELSVNFESYLGS